MGRFSSNDGFVWALYAFVVIEAVALAGGARWCENATGLLALMIPILYWWVLVPIELAIFTIGGFVRLSTAAMNRLFLVALGVATISAFVFTRPSPTPCLPI